MRKFLQVFLLMFFLQACLVTTVMANCAIDKKPEFDALNKELRQLDVDLALEAKRAYGMISAYEAFDSKGKECEYIDALLKDVRDMIEILKPE